MGGNALRAVVWPPYTHDDIWADGGCVMILGAKVNIQYHLVIVNSDAVVLEDQAVAQNEYPQELTPLNLSSVEVQQPSSEMGCI